MAFHQEMGITMLLNEHNSKILFSKIDIPTPRAITVAPGQAEETTPPFPLPWYLKSQVLTGGRGKAGGILRVTREEDFIDTAKTLFSLKIKDQLPPFIRIEPAIPIEREFYLSLTLSREKKCILLTVGRQGGIEIEKLGKENLLVQQIYLPEGLLPHQIRSAFFHLNITNDNYGMFSKIVSNLFKGMLDYGLLMAEINPLVIDNKNQFTALDGKVEIDDNYVDLNPAMEEFYQREHATAEENTARDAGLSYVSLPGWVGLMVNGAGLAMASMDLLNLSNLPASNFLDLGGAADQKRMQTALELLFGDHKVKAIFINLFGGILSCEKVALALKGALNGMPPQKPIVARMAGNDANAGLAILTAMNTKNLHIANDMQSAICLLHDFTPKNAPPSVVKSMLSFPRQTRKRYKKQTDGYPFELSKETPVLVQGITGREGQLHTRLMLDYGTNVVAGVTPFKGGKDVLNIPVYNSIVEAKANHEIGATIIFVPPSLATDAIMEAACNEIPWAICITEGIVQHQMIATLEQTRHSKTKIIGPNSPGIIIPDAMKIGIMPTTPFSAGPVAILSRSGTLTYEVADRLTSRGIGQSLCLGIGGDPFIGTDFVELFEMLKYHDKTEAIVVLGEIGGQAEENLAEYVLSTGFHKPVVSFIAGCTAPPGKRLGHAGAILETEMGIEQKLKIMHQAGFTVCLNLETIAETLISILK